MKTDTDNIDDVVERDMVDEIIQCLKSQYDAPREHLKRPSIIHVEEVLVKQSITSLKTIKPLQEQLAARDAEIAVLRKLFEASFNRTFAENNAEFAKVEGGMDNLVNIVRDAEKKYCDWLDENASGDCRDRVI